MSTNTYAPIIRRDSLDTDTPDTNREVIDRLTDELHRLMTEARQDYTDNHGEVTTTQTNAYADAAAHAQDAVDALNALLDQTGSTD